MVSTASLLGAWHLWEVVENKLASSLAVSLGKALNGSPLSLCGRQVAQTPQKWQLPSKCGRPVQNVAIQFAFSWMEDKYEQIQIQIQKYKLALKSFSANFHYRADTTTDFIKNLISKRLLFFFYLPDVSSIHKKANCIANFIHKFLSPNFLDILEFAKFFNGLVLMLKDIWTKLPRRTKLPYFTVLCVECTLAVQVFFSWLLKLTNQKRSKVTCSIHH